MKLIYWFLIIIILHSTTVRCLEGDRKEFENGKIPHVTQNLANSRSENSEDLIKVNRLLAVPPENLLIIFRFCDKKDFLSLILVSGIYNKLIMSSNLMPPAKDEELVTLLNTSYDDALERIMRYPSKKTFEMLLKIASQCEGYENYETPEAYQLSINAWNACMNLLKPGCLLGHERCLAQYKEKMEYVGSVFLTGHANIGDRLGDDTPEYDAEIPKFRAFYWELLAHQDKVARYHLAQHYAKGKYIPHNPSMAEYWSNYENKTDLKEEIMKPLLSGSIIYPFRTRSLDEIKLF